MDKKRLLIAIGFLILCILLGFLLWKVFFAPKETPIETFLPEKITTSTLGQFPEAGLGGATSSRPTGGSTLPTAETIPGRDKNQDNKKPVTQVVSDTIKGVSGGKDGARYYNAQDGKFYKLDQNGQVVPLDEKVFFNVEKVTWAPQKNEGILEYPDGSNIYYNFETKEQVTLPKHWEEFSFSGANDKIAAKSIAISENGNWLITSQNNGKNVKLVEPMGANADKVNVTWSPNQQIIATSRTGDSLGADREEILFVGQNHENFKSLEVDGRGFMGEWSPQGNKLIYSVHSERSDYKPELWVVNGKPSTLGSERKLLGINTWANKCTFQDERYMYCGVPDSLDTGAGFVPELSAGNPDTLYKIDLQTGSKTPIELTEQHSVDTIFVGEDGKTLFFTDKNYNGLFEVPL